MTSCPLDLLASYVRPSLQLKIQENEDKKNKGTKTIYSSISIINNSWVPGVFVQKKKNNSWGVLFLEFE